LKAANGSEMLLHQAAIAFERWTGLMPPLAAMRQALDEALGETGEARRTQ
jgi:shikimate 5-dehydrogenase